MINMRRWIALGWWKEEAFEEQVFLSSNGKLGGNCNDLKEKKAIFGHQPGPFRSGLLLRPEKATQGDNFLYYVFLCIHYAERQTINFYHILITVSVFSSRRQSESGKYTKDRSAGVAWKMVAYIQCVHNSSNSSSRREKKSLWHYLSIHAAFLSFYLLSQDEHPKRLFALVSLRPKSGLLLLAKARLPGLKAHFQCTGI